MSKKIKIKIKIKTTLTPDEYERLLNLLGQPVPPGKLRDLDIALIRKFQRLS